MHVRLRVSGLQPERVPVRAPEGARARAAASPNAAATADVRKDDSICDTDVEEGSSDMMSSSMTLPPTR